MVPVFKAEGQRLGDNFKPCCYFLTAVRIARSARMQLHDLQRVWRILAKAQHQPSSRSAMEGTKQRAQKSLRMGH